MRRADLSEPAPTECRDFFHQVAYRENAATMSQSRLGGCELPSRFKELRDRAPIVEEEGENLFFRLSFGVQRGDFVESAVPKAVSPTSGARRNMKSRPWGMWAFEFCL